MATSSIFANVKITDPQRAEAFIEAMDAAANTPKKEYEEKETRFLVNDVAAIRALMAKRTTKK